MNFIKLVMAKQENLMAEKVPTVAFIGDSVTHGCFELEVGDRNQVEAVYDVENAYPHYFRKILSVLYPRVPINLIYAGINGDGTKGGIQRLERDVLSYHPDLTVVCFGLNDVHKGKEYIPTYCQNLSTIFGKIQENGGEVVFMTPNMMNTYVQDCQVYVDRASFLNGIAEKTAQLQNDGTFDAFIEAAKQTAVEKNVLVCDVYSKWKALQKNGVSTTRLLSNYINHPTRELHWLFAYSLMETIMNA